MQFHASAGSAAVVNATTAVAVLNNAAILGINLFSSMLPLFASGLVTAAQDGGLQLWQHRLGAWHTCIYQNTYQT